MKPYTTGLTCPCLDLSIKNVKINESKMCTHLFMNTTVHRMAKFIHPTTVQITLIFYAKWIWFLANAFAPALGNTQTCLGLLWIGLRIWNVFGMNWKFTFCICLVSEILICERLVGLVSFETNVSKTAGQIHEIELVLIPGWFITWLSDNVQCKGHQTHL